MRPLVAATRTAVLGVVTVATAAVAAAQEPLLGVRVDADRNRLLLEIPAAHLDRPLMHQTVLATGAGVNALGLDRGQVGGEAIVRFERRGRRVLLVTDNQVARAPGATPDGQRAAAEAFPRAVLASFAVESDTGGRVVVDATGFFLSDTYGIADALRRSQQGTARVDAQRSWFDAARTRAFPRNAEIHAVLTFGVDNPGPALRRWAADAGSAVFELHHSLVALPDSVGFRPREGDPRSGYFGTSFLDFSQGFDGTYRASFINRWRLVPRDPAAYQRGVLTEPVTPIVYYLDPAIPAPYREAFREGGNWWSTVFEAAGFKNAFQVRDLPTGADPMDARYNLIYWVHRNGPGPSVGPSFADPRTGELVRTVVRMDSYRSLIDYNIWAGLLPAAGSAAGLGMSAEAFTMARRRQHTAHEIGHTLGLAHNFIAASQGRSSVMDYPFPLVSVGANGRLDLSRAYAPFAGAWDSLAIRFGYTWYPTEEAEAAGQRRIVEEGIRRNVRFVTDQHAGAEGSIPTATRWVEGATMFDAVERTTAVRRVAMAAFDERAIAPGEPLYLLSMRFLHVYLHHRYSLEGLVKHVGGMDFRYAMRGDGQVPTLVVPPAEQRRALGLALDALAPAQLEVPERVLALIPPVPPGGEATYDWLPRAGTAVDQVALAGGLATEVIEGLLERDRMQRVALFHARDPRQPPVAEVLDTILARTWDAPDAATSGLQALQRAVRRVVLNTLLDRAGDGRASADVRQVIALRLRMLRERVAAAGASGSAADQALRAAAVREIARFEAGDDDPASRTRYSVIPLPWP
jgi:hypothetical protein